VLKKQVLIIGNSAAGIGALEAIRRFDSESRITLLTEERHPIYSRCLLSYLLAARIGEDQLCYRPADFPQQMNADMQTGKRVETVLPERQEVQCTDGSRVEYDRLLIATGGSAKIPDTIPKSAAGIFVLRTLDDAHAILQALHSTQHAVILGGGLIGMKAAFALSQRGLRITVVVRSAHVLSQMIDAQAAVIIMEKLAAHNITVLSGADISSVQLRDNHLAAVNVSTSADHPEYDLPCQMLVVAKGVEPNLELIHGTSVQTGRAIVTDSRMRTNIENIFAAGDVAETWDRATEHYAVNALWTCAAQQGRIAGHNMIGRISEYDGSIGMNSVNFSGTDLVSFGVVQPPLNSAYKVLTDYRPRQGIYKKIVLKDNRIKGLILVNRIHQAGLLLSLLSRKIDVAGYKEELLEDRFHYAKLIGIGSEEEWGRYSKAPQKNSAYRSISG